MDHLSKKWTLQSLTIGPQLCETNTQFWEEALDGLPPLRRVTNVTIIYNFPTAKAVNTDCWGYFDRILTLQNLFPALESVKVQPSIGSRQFSPRRWMAVHASLREVRLRKLMTGKLLAFKRDHRTYRTIQTNAVRRCYQMVRISVFSSRDIAGDLGGPPPARIDAIKFQSRPRQINVCIPESINVLFGLRRHPLIMRNRTT